MIWLGIALVICLPVWAVIGLNRLRHRRPRGTGRVAEETS